MKDKKYFVLNDRKGTISSSIKFEEMSEQWFKLDVNMFKAADNYLINDGCGLFRGRQILPFEHLSRFQNNLID